MQQQFAWVWSTRSFIETGDAKAFVAAMADSLGRGLDRPWKIYILGNTGLEPIRLFKNHSVIRDGVTTDTYTVHPVHAAYETILQFVVVRESDARSSRVD